MADNVEIQGLEFQIQEDSAEAIKGLDSLTATLTKLKAATSGGVSGLSATAKQLERLDTALAGLDVRSTEKLIGLANGLRALGQIGQIKVSSSIASQVNALGTALEHIQLTDKDKLAALAEGLRPLSELEKANLSSFLSQLSKLPEIVQKLDEVDMEKFVRQMKELHEAMQPLAQDMSNVSSGFSSFPAQMQKAASALNSAKKGQSSSASKGFLPSLLNKVGLDFTLQKVADLLSDAITNSNKYQEDLNLFTVVMGKYAEEALEYGETVSDVMGIDLSDWIRNQGVFNTLFTGFGNVADRAAIMSKNLTQLGYDISSFFNISVDTAMQKLQSGISGELEPLRRLGYDLSQAKLQETALALGIEKKLSAMTQAEKAELRYYAIMTQVTAAQGDMARTLEAPANQLRILKAQFEMAGRAIGNIFIPMLNSILPVAIAVMQVIRDLASAIASLFGFKLTEVDYSGVGDLASGADDASEALGDAASAAKKLQDYTAGFDELNIFAPSTAAGSGAGAAGGGSAFDFELPEYDFLGDAMNDRIKKIKKELEELLPVIAGVGAGLAAWEIATHLFPQLSKLDALLGSLMVAVGVTLIVDSIRDIIVNGLNWKNILEGVAGGAIAGGGLGFMIAKALGLDWVDGMLTGAVIGIGVVLLIDAVTSILAHGLDIRAALLGTVGSAVAGAMTGSKIEQIGAGFGATIGISVALAIMGISSIIKDGSNPVNGLMTALGTAFAAGQLIFKLGKLTAVAGAVASIGVTLGLLMAIGGFVYQIKNGADPLAGFISILGTVFAGAGIGLAVGGGPVGAAVGAAIGLVVGIGLEFIGIDTAAKAAYEASEDFRVMEGVIERCTEVSERCASAMDALGSNFASLDQVSSDFAAASTLVDEIFAINENANASAYELELMRVKVDVLNGMNIAGLSLSIDETTGRVIESRGEVEKLIEALQREAEIEAMNQLLVEAYKDRAQAQRDLTKATQDQNTASEALQQTTEELANCPWYELTRHQELTRAQEEQNKALDAANQAYEDAQTALSELEGAIEDYSGRIVDLKSAEEGVGDELVEGLGNVRAGLEETGESMEGYGKMIREGLLRGLDRDSSEVEYRQRWRQIPDSFRDELEIHSPSKLFERFGEDIDTGLLNGLSESWGLIGSFFEEKTNAIKQTCSETWESVKSTASEKWEDIKSDLGTAWENIKTDAADKFTQTKEQISIAWESTKTDTVSKWNWIKSDVGNKWAGIKTDAETKFESVRNGIAAVWDSTQTKTSSTWHQISGSLSTSWDAVDKTANEKFGTVKKSISGIWDSLVTSATKWGSDICNNIASGIESAKGFVTSAVTSVAENIRSFLHFSEPDVGPLSDFHTYMPDMMDLMAEGIRSNEDVAVDAVYDLANSVARAFERVSAQNMDFRVEETMAVRYTDDSNGFPQADSRWEDHSKVEVDNEEIIAALFAVGQQIVTAINEKDSNTYIDGKQMMQAVEKHQRQRGANIMAGGVMP